MPDDLILPPKHPYSDALAKRIFALTALRDNKHVAIFKEYPAEQRDEHFIQVRADWCNQVYDACHEAFEHAETLVENLKQLHAGIQEMQRATAAMYPAGDGR
jgi:hypothetical protein